ILDADEPALRRRFAEIYGPDPALHEERRRACRETLLEFARVYGTDSRVLIIRSPGRVNLMGRHVDHRGGHNNLVAINKELLMIVEERPDNNVALHNRDFQQFKFRTFNIGEEVAALDWDDWISTINSEKVMRMVREAGGDWANYVKAAALRLQEKFRNRRIRGMNVMVSGNIPMGAGLSSSSAMVVAAAEAIVEVNGLEVNPQQFVNLCGEGEWFVGTRGGSGDHAAIKLSRRGAVAHVRFYPFEVESIVPFPEGHRVVVCASGIQAKKAANARDVFNQCIAAYEAGCLFFRKLLPHKAARIEYLRDVNTGTLECSEADILRLVKGLPDRISRSEMLRQLKGQDTSKLETLFLSHNEPAEGYRVRGVSLFGIAECLRSRDCVEFLGNTGVGARGFGGTGVPPVTHRPEACATGGGQGLGGTGVPPVTHRQDACATGGGQGLGGTGVPPVTHRPEACATGGGQGLGGTGVPPVAAFGRLMTLSHDGDRVSRLDAAGRRQPIPLEVSDAELDSAIAACERSELRLLEVPGSYACSTPEMDSMVDIALGVEGVVGAQLAGAGLGGCIMVLCRDDATAPLRDALTRGYYEPAGRPPQVEPCVPVEGSGILEL
ncbi:MAG: hypothetical protein FJ291_03975, partial [Planctomycetes bacterium]|nr:hypothetical protein [Planctomycetota bacterium]